jgi:hypothetical protein
LLLLEVSGKDGTNEKLTQKWPQRDLKSSDIVLENLEVHVHIQGYAYAS